MGLKITASGFDRLKKTAKSVRAIPEAVNRATFRAVNAVAAKSMTAARREIGEEVNLPQGYLREQMALFKARPKATVAEVRFRVRAVRLARFAALQLTKPAPRAKGDSSRGIPSGRKAAGVSVKVKRAGGRRRLPGGFLIPLRGSIDGTGNGVGLFIRTGKGRRAIEHLYGPRPSDYFNSWKGRSRNDIGADLLDEYRRQLKFELSRVFR